MSDLRFPKAIRAHAELRKKLSPDAVAVAHATQCPWCIGGHVKAARRAGASPEQIMEAIWVAAEMRAGAAYAHSVKTLELLQDGDGTGGQ